MVISYNAKSYIWIHHSLRRDVTFALDKEDHSSNSADMDSVMIDVDTPFIEKKKVPLNAQTSKNVKRKLISDDVQPADDLDKMMIDELSG